MFIKGSEYNDSEALYKHIGVSQITVCIKMTGIILLNSGHNIFRFDPFNKKLMGTNTSRIGGTLISRIKVLKRIVYC